MANGASWSQAGFLAKLAAYFLALGLLLVGIFGVVPLLFNIDQTQALSGEVTRTIIEGLLESSGQPPALEHETLRSRIAILGVLSFSFLSTVTLMIPITWVYMHTHPDSYRRSLVTALIILPICATATVWLIQDSLPLAFGLAALVAAVRFRIRLDNALDGVYVFSAISVGLASGVGHIGVGFVMAVFFCFCASILWIFRYGKRPRDDVPAGTTTTAAAAAAGPIQDTLRQAS